MIYKIRFIIAILFFLRVLTYAQNKGIHFEQALTWSQVKAKARTENKFIFVDCYATWCGPCKTMDKDVYPNDSIGAYMNARFISVKVQLDTSKLDDAEIKKWYQTAQDIRKQYAINAMPTFLFFDAGGGALTKEVGAKSAKAFLHMIRSVSEKKNQYYALLKDYQNGQLPAELKPTLALKANQLGEKDLALEVATDYMHKYLDKLNDEQFCSKENQDFLNRFSKMITYHDRAFQLFYHQPSKIDSVIYPGYALVMANLIIYNQEISPYMELAAKSGKKIVDWNLINKNISKKFRHPFGAGTVVDAQVIWYKHLRDYKNYAKYLTLSTDQKFESLKATKGWGGWFNLNNAAFDVFKYSETEIELRRAIVWIDAALPMVGNDKGYIAGLTDTKANLLYKLNERREAISLEETAYLLDPTKSISETLDKMKKGLRTWDDN
jgi:thioredoxin-related protein